MDWKVLSKYKTALLWVAAFVVSYLSIYWFCHGAAWAIKIVIGVSISQGTAGFYAMEIIGLLCASTALLWRLISALSTVESLKQIGSLFQERAAQLSIEIALILTLLLHNRWYWYDLALFSEAPYDYTDYTASARSLMVASVCVLLVYTLSKENKTTKKFYRRRSIQLAFATNTACWLGFWATLFMVR